MNYRSIERRLLCHAFQGIHRAKRPLRSSNSPAIPIVYQPSPIIIGRNVFLWELGINGSQNCTVSLILLLLLWFSFLILPLVDFSSSGSASCFRVVLWKILRYVHLHRNIEYLCKVFLMWLMCPTCLTFWILDVIRILWIEVLNRFNLLNNLILSKSA